MAKPFELPDWRKRQIREKFRRKDLVISHAVSAMEAVMRQAVDYIIAHWTATQRYVEPSLNEMYAVGDGFYHGCIRAGYQAAQEEKKDSQGRKRMARRPRELHDLEDLLHKGKLWKGAKKRLKKLTDRLRRSYLEKLRKRFDLIMPAILEGKIDIPEVKAQMMDAWDASKSRVETIFRTETTNYFGKAQVEFFSDDPEIIGFLFDSVRDSSRTDICRSRHGLVYRPGTPLLKSNTPALHYNCRSHLIALANTPHNRKLVEDPDRDPAKRKVAPPPPGWRK